MRFRFSWTNPRQLVWLGLLIREAFSFWTGHPFDLEVWIRNAYFVSLGQNPYSHFLPPVPGLSFTYLRDTLPSVGYLPLWSFIAAGLYLAYTAIPGNIPYVFYFLLKQPVILADVGLGVLLFRATRRWGGTREIATKTLRYWMLFPYPIVVGAMWGQFDAIVVDLLLLFLLSSQWWKQYGYLGLGILLKWFPVVLLPFFLFRERWSRKVGVLVALAIPALFTVSVFFLMGWDYVGVTGMAEYSSHGNIGGVTYSSLLGYPSVYDVFSRIPYFYAVLGYLWVPGIAIGGFAAHRIFRDSTPQATIQGIMFATLAFFLTRQGVNEQYLLYLLPFLLVDVALWHPERRLLFRLTWLLCFAYLLLNNDFLVRIVGPVNGSFVDIAYAADASPLLGGIRTTMLYLLDFPITITFVQLLLVVANPSRNPRPWPLTLASLLRNWVFGPRSKHEAGSREVDR